MPEYNFEELSTTELAELARKKTGRRASSREDLLKILSGEKIPPTKEEESRKKLQVYVQENWTAIQTNIPCALNLNAGKCTKYACSSIQHLECLKGANL